MKKELNVSALKNGTVIDHIPADALFKVINVLRLDQYGDEMITFGTNLDSKRLGKKAIIKISDKFFQEEDVNKIALFAPSAVLNVIKDYSVVEKNEVRMPQNFYGIVKCQNPVCVTNHENVLPNYKLIDTEPVSLKCNYCEKITVGDDLKLID